MTCDSGLMKPSPDCKLDASALFLKDDKKKDGAGAVVFSEGVPTPRA